MTITRVEGYRRDIPYGVCAAADEATLIAHLTDNGFVYWGVTPQLVTYDGRIMWPVHTSYRNFSVDKEKPTSIQIHDLGTLRHVYAWPHHIITELHDAGVITAATVTPAVKLGQLSLFDT